MTLNAILEKDTAYIRAIPKKLNNVPPPSNINAEDITDIKANQNHVVTINDEVIALDALEKKLIPILKKFKEDDFQHIRIEVSQQTKYSVFAQIHSAIEEAHRKVLEFYSYREVGLELDKLSEEQRSKLEKMHPCRVIEAKPN